MHRPSVGTVFKTEWSKHWAWRPVRSYSGRWTWLKTYYRCTEYVNTPIIDMPYKNTRLYTANEAMFFMMEKPL